MTKKHLTEEEARPLKSREISKIISAVLGGFASWCDPEEIVGALTHIDANLEKYTAMIKTMNYVSLQVDRPPKTSQIDQRSKEKLISFLLLTLCTMTEKTDPEILVDIVTAIATNPTELSNLLSLATESGSTEKLQAQVHDLTQSLLRQG